MCGNKHYCVNSNIQKKTTSTISELFLVQNIQYLICFQKKTLRSILQNITKLQRVVCEIHKSQIEKGSQTLKVRSHIHTNYPKNTTNSFKTVVTM